MSRPIVLATLNARYAHASFGLRCLLANLGELRSRTELLELEIQTPRLEVVERILALDPVVLGLGVYVWNVAELTGVVADLKALRPDLVIVLGGPEVSHEPERQEIVRLADHVVAGEADLAFAELARRLVAGERPAQKVIEAPLPPLEERLHRAVLDVLRSRGDARLLQKPQPERALSPLLEEEPMPHYKDGTEAKIGDQVIGRGYNVKHVISGVVVSLTPGTDTCNLSVAHALRYDGYGTLPNAFPMMSVEYGQTDRFERADLHAARLEAEEKAKSDVVAWVAPGSTAGGKL